MDFEFVVAKKYATAYLTLAGSSFDEQELLVIEKLQKFLKSSREILFFFNLPLIDHEVKQGVVDKLSEDLQTKKLFEKLLHLLFKERRALLIPLILGYMCSLYRTRNNILSFAISSSHELSEEDKKTVEYFLASRTGKKVDARYALDSSLIAGIRALSSTLKWEQSVKKELRVIRQSLAEQGVSWN